MNNGGNYWKNVREKMNKTLRPYQQECVDAVFKRLEEGVSRQLIVLPTGSGKSITLTNIVKEFKRVLWITHRLELINQSSEYLKQLNRSVGIIKAEQFDIDHPIVVSSLQTLYRRLDRIPKDYFDCIVCDEAHIFLSKTAILPLQFFAPKLLIGATATPTRMDGMSLGNIFDEIVYEKDIKFGIDNGFLCEINAIRIKTELSLDSVRTTAGELNQKDLRLLDTPNRNKLIVDSYKKYATGRQAIVFCVDVEHCKNLYQEFIDAGISSTFVVADEKICPNRTERIEGYKTGKYTIILNVEILTTGADFPETACVIAGRPTKSLTLYLQSIGRGTRLKTHYKDCVILDIVDNTSRHELINTWTLDKNKPIEERVFITSENRQKLLEKRKASLEHILKQDVKVNLLQLPIVKISDSYRMREGATVAQLDWLKREGYDIDTNTYTKGQCSEIISSLPATEKQLWVLKKHNYDLSKGCTRGQASIAIDRIMDKKEVDKIISNTNFKFNGIK